MNFNTKGLSTLELIVYIFMFLLFADIPANLV